MKSPDRSGLMTDQSPNVQEFNTKGDDTPLRNERSLLDFNNLIGKNPTVPDLRGTIHEAMMPSTEQNDGPNIAGIKTVSIERGASGSASAMSNKSARSDNRINVNETITSKVSLNKSGRSMEPVSPEQAKNSQSIEEKKVVTPEMPGVEERRETFNPGEAGPF